METTTTKTNITRTQKLVMIGRFDYQITQHLTIPKYVYTKGTTTVEQELLSRRENNVDFSTSRKRTAIIRRHR